MVDATSPPPAVLLDGEEECKIQQVLAHRERSRGKKHKHPLEFFVSWKGMGPEHSEWLSQSESMKANEVVQEYSDSLGPQDRPAARVGRPAQSDPSQSAEVISAGANAQGTSTAKGEKRGRLGSKMPKVVLLSLLLLRDLWVVLRSKSSVLGSFCVML